MANHNWSQILHWLISNRMGETLDGEPGSWDTALFQLIAESYKQTNDDQDLMVLCTLICLHEGIKGKLDLEDLAEACMEISKRADRKQAESN